MKMNSERLRSCTLYVKTILHHKITGLYKNNNFWVCGDVTSIKNLTSLLPPRSVFVVEIEHKCLVFIRNIQKFLHYFLHFFCVHCKCLKIINLTHLLPLMQISSFQAMAMCSIFTFSEVFQYSRVTNLHLVIQ